MSLAPVASDPVGAPDDEAPEPSATSPEREAYPGSNSWGALGWTCFTLQAAQALARALRTAQEAA